MVALARIFSAFLQVEDLADAGVLVFDDLKARQIPMYRYTIESGQAVTIAELATLIQSVVGNRGEMEWDAINPTAPIVICGTLRAWMRIATKRDDGIRSA